MERVWREEGFQLPLHHKKRKRPYQKDGSVIRPRPNHQNSIWSMDFVQDKSSNGHSCKVLTILDKYTKEALCVAVRHKMNANNVSDILLDLIVKRGKPQYISSDKGPEFIVEHLQTWLQKVGFEPSQTYPGSPSEKPDN